MSALLSGEDIPSVLIFPEFIQLMDDDIVSLSALVLIADPVSRVLSDCYKINQLTLSLYLMTQCQLKLHHSVTSLSQTLHYIDVAQRKLPADLTLDHLTLKFTRRKVIIYLTSLIYIAVLKVPYVMC